MGPGEDLALVGGEKLCYRCQRPIPAPRLAIFPDAILCVPCKQRPLADGTSLDEVRKKAGDIGDALAEGSPFSPSEIVGFMHRGGS